METLKGIFGTAKDSSTEATRPKAIERTPSGTKKWIKELSPLANSVVGRCARYTKPTNQPTNQRLMLFFFPSMGVQDRINCSVTLLQLDFQL
jgi:hypothetical protein